MKIWKRKMKIKRWKKERRMNRKMKVEKWEREKDIRKKRDEKGK